MNSELNDFYLRPMVTSDLELVLEWRNHSEIRRYMFTKHEITLEEHVRWFERESKNRDRSLLIFGDNDHALGFVQFYVLCFGRIASWGFYIAPDAPMGTGSKLGHTALEYAFTQMKLHKICGQALDFNEKSIKFHHRLGFRQEGIRRDQHFDGTCYYSVVSFGLTEKEWAIGIRDLKE